MSSTLTVYFLTRRNGRFGSSTACGASPNAGGAVPKSAAAGAVSTCTVTFTGATGACATGAGG